MTRFERITLGALLSMAMAGGALAQTATTSMTMGMGPFTKETYPEAYVDRPLTLVAGMIEARPAVGYAKLTLTDPVTGMSSSADATDFALEVGYGITDQLEAGVSTGLGIDPEFEWSKDLGVYAMFLALDQDQLDVAARVDVPFFFEDGVDTFQGFVLGAPVRYKVMEQLAVYAGHGLVPIQTSDPSQVDLDLNLGVAFQATPQLALRLDTQPLSVAISGDGNETTSYADVIPLGFTALFAINNKIDGIATVVLPSVEDAGDLYAFAVGANVRL